MNVIIGLARSCERWYPRDEMPKEGMQMAKRWLVLGCAAMAWLLAMPLTARSQDDAPPVEFTGPLAHPRVCDDDDGFAVGCGSVQFKQIPIFVTSDQRLAVFTGANRDGPVVRVLGELFLGATPLGGFSASLDAQASIFTSGPGVSLNWFPFEGAACSWRFDLLRGEFYASTTIVP
jgi:hypothetical protein